VEKCYCGATLDYSQCCQPFHDGAHLPASAEALMRSRYSAFVVENIQYIKDTMTGEMLDGFSYDDTLAYAKSVDWQRLKVLAAADEDPTATSAWVEFEVYYRLNGLDKCLYEYSLFQRTDERWFYVDSVKTRVTDCGDRTKNTLGRNSPCHCGSGKKFKKCCL
jgi:SEC-C motif domain protein